MPKSIRSVRHEALRHYVIARREAAGLTQIEVAARLGRYQSFVARIETGQKVVDVVELFDLAEALAFDPVDAIRTLKRAL